MSTAIILDGQLKSALTAVRSLGMKEVEVSVGAEQGSAMSLHSRYTKDRFIYPSPYTNLEGFVDAVKAEAVRIGNKPVVYAFSDVTYLALFLKQEELRDCMTLMFPREESVLMAFDKAATYSLARVSGVPTITTYTPELREEVEHLGTKLAYPAVIKTRRSVTWKGGVGTFGSASFVHSSNELVGKFFELKTILGEAPLIQDFIQGEEYGVEMIAHEGKIIASLVHHRLR